MSVSIRSLLVAGLTVTAASVSVSVPAEGSPVATSAAPLYRLAAAVSPLVPPVEAAAASEYAPLATVSSVEPAAATAAAVGSVGDFIINAYNAIEPWVAWGFDVVQWGMGFVPLLWWFAPGVDLAYYTVEPLVQSLVYSFAYLIDGSFALIGPTIQAGIQEAAENFVQYSIYWFESLIPFPPLPPWPPFPGAAVAAGAAGVTRAAATTAPDAAPAVDNTAVGDTAVGDTAEASEADGAQTAPDTAAPAEIAAAPQPRTRTTKRSAAHARSAEATPATEEPTANVGAEQQDSPTAPPRSGKGAATRASGAAAAPGAGHRAPTR